jgi:hypothetical protein
VGISAVGVSKGLSNTDRDREEHVVGKAGVIVGGDSVQVCEGL